MNFIENIIEPRKLLLVWKDKKASKLCIIGEIIRENGSARLVYLIDREDFKHAQEAGFVSFPAFPDVNKSYNKNILENY